MPPTSTIVTVEHTVIYYAIYIVLQSVHCYSLLVVACADFVASWLLYSK